MVEWHYGRVVQNVSVALPLLYRRYFYSSGSAATFSLFLRYWANVGQFGARVGEVIPECMRHLKSDAE